MPRPKVVTSTPKSEDDTAEDDFIDLVQRQLKGLLEKDLDFKEKNAVITNAIRFIQVRNRLRGDDEGNFFGD